MASGQTVLDLDIMASGLKTPNGGSTNSASSETIVVRTVKPHQHSSIMASGQTVLDLDIMASGLKTPNGGSTNSASSETIVVRTVKRHQHRGKKGGKKRFKSTIPEATTNPATSVAIVPSAVSPAIQPMYLNSVHTYADKKGNCSLITRHVEEKAIDAIDAIYSQGSKEAQYFRNTRVAMGDSECQY
jgi:hypothetical protein